TFVIGPDVKGLKALLDRVEAKETNRSLEDVVRLAAAGRHVVAGVTPEFVALMLFRGPSGDVPPGNPPPPPPPPGENPKGPAAARGAPPAPPGRRPAEPPRDPAAQLDQARTNVPWVLLPYKPLLRSRMLGLALHFGAETRLEFVASYADED